MNYVVAIDIGGTGTDCVVVDDGGEITLAKAFSTPPDFERGILDALDVAARALDIARPALLGDTRMFLHSTTVAENAVVDGTLAKAGVLTTGGFEDTLFSMRGGYGRWSGLTEEEKRNPIDTDKLPPIVDRTMIRGLHERTDATGAVVVATDEDEIRTAARELLDSGAEALGVSLLWSFANPSNEHEVKRLLAEVAPGTFLTISSDIAPNIGEYERTSTVALNASLGPVVKRYLEKLRSALVAEGFQGALLVSQAYGGLLPFDEALSSPVGMIESGPVSGLVGSKHLGELIGVRDVIAADMGGTTFKVGVVREGLIEYQRESMVLRYHYALPKMDVVSLGLAGGSIVSIDERTGTPRIGPRSAGSYPGPVCYGHGGDEATITDIDAVLGYLNSDYFFAGREGLDVEGARAVIAEKIAGPLGMGVVEAAAAMYRLANSQIYDLLHKTTIQRGLDPRKFALFSFGGTAGMHVGAYGEQLGVDQIVIPNSASVHGAFGLITSDIVHEAQMTHPLRAPIDPAAVAEIFDELSNRISRQLHDEGFEDDQITLTRSMEMRYRRQVHMLTVPLAFDGPVDGGGLERTVDLFETLYREKYGNESAYREAGIEAVSYRLRGSGAVGKPALRTYDDDTGTSSEALVKHVEAWVEAAGEVQAVPGYDFEMMRTGAAVDGPAVVWSPITTLVVPAGHQVRVDEYRNLIMARASN